MFGTKEIAHLRPESSDTVRSDGPNVMACRRLILPSITASMCLLAAGCVSITSYPLPPSVIAGSPSTVEGIRDAIPYTLPKTSFSLTAIYTIDCIGSEDVQKVLITPSWTLSALNVPDENERYYVRSSDLKSWFKDSQITFVSNNNQTLSSINGTVNDLAGPAIVTAVGVAASAYGGAVLGGVSSLALASAATNHQFVDLILSGSKLKIEKVRGSRPLACNAHLNSKTAEHLSTLRELRAEINARTTDLISKKIDVASDPNLSALSTEIAAITAHYLTIKASLVWSPSPANDAVAADGIVTHPANGSDLVTAQWFDNADPAAVARDLAKATSDVGVNATIELKFAKWSYKSNGPAAAAPEAKNEAQNTASTTGSPAIDGLVLRSPASATARLCQGISCPREDDGTLEKNTAVIARIDNLGVPQYGTRLYVPFENELFQNTTVQAVIAADGTITTLGNHDAGTASAGLTTLGTDATTVSSALAARNAAIGARNTAVQAQAQFPDTINKALADCLTQRNLIISLGGVPTVACQ